MLLQENSRNVAKRHKEEFLLWFERKSSIIQKEKQRGKTKGFSIQKKRKESDNGELKVTIPPDRTVAIGPGANDFVTEISVKVSKHAKHDVKKWKDVPDLSKDRIVVRILDVFQLPDIEHNWETILRTAKNLYQYRRNRLHQHFKKFATKEETLQNMPLQVDAAEWKFLVECFSSDDFKKDTNNGKEPNFQKLWEMTHMKNGNWVDDASAKLSG